MSTRRTGIVMAAVLTVALLQACSPTKITRGYHLEPEDVARIQEGVTTQQQVTEILGSPSSIATFKQNSDTWYYITRKSERYTELDESVVDQKVLAITFDEAGRVATVKDYTLDDSRDISYSSRETPTQGAKLGVIEQLFQNLLGGGVGQ